MEVYQQQIDMEKLCHQGELLLKKVSDQTDRDMIQEPLTELRHLWENLGDKITHRQVLKPREAEEELESNMLHISDSCFSLQSKYSSSYF